MFHYLSCLSVAVFKAKEMIMCPRYCKSIQLDIVKSVWGEWPSGLYSFRQVTEVKLGRVRSDCGWVTSEA